MNAQAALGHRLAYGRKLAELTQPEIALKLRAIGVDMSLDKVKSIETGRRPARALEVAGYARVVGRDPGWFYADLPATFGDAIPGLLGFDLEPSEPHLLVA